MRVDHWLGWLMGVWPVPDGTSPFYQVWSGFFPSCAILYAIGKWVRVTNCHVHRCWRHGHYVVGSYKVCRRHHPGIGDHVTQEMVDAEHSRQVSADT